MGKRNRKRQRHTPPPARPHRPAGAGEAAVERAAASALAVALRQGAAAAAALLAELAGSFDAASVCVALTGQLERLVVPLWAEGWQPADLVRVVDRKLGHPHGELVAAVVVSQARSYAAVPVDPRWSAQLEALRARPASPALPPGPGFVLAALEVAALLCRLPRLAKLIPPPGEVPASHRDRPAAGGIDGKMLERIRALLAKAESTTFPDEAEALTAKAQELMARYSIDRALVDARGAEQHVPVGRRVGLDDPYVRAKAMLLHEVASANRCRSVSSHDLGFATVVGFAADVELVELLFTSLLVQATRAMTAPAVRAGHAERSAGGVRSFRQSFLVAYACRIGERLREATRSAESAACAEVGGNVLPVLAGRERRVDDAYAAAFPNVVSFRPAARDRSGWIAGRAAADLANLRVGQEVERRAR